MNAWVRQIAQVPSAAAVLLICGYKVLIRPLLIGTCSFHPSCSDYAVQALTTHGLVRGGWLALRRLLRFPGVPRTRSPTRRNR